MGKSLTYVTIILFLRDLLRSLSLRLTPTKRQSDKGELSDGGESQKNVFSSIFSSSGSERSSEMKMKLAADGCLQGGGINNETDLEIKENDR